MTLIPIERSGLQLYAADGPDRSTYSDPQWLALAVDAVRRLQFSAFPCSFIFHSPPDAREMRRFQIGLGECCTLSRIPVVIIEIAPAQNQGNQSSRTAIAPPYNRECVVLRQYRRRGAASGGLPGIPFVCIVRLQPVDECAHGLQPGVAMSGQ